MMTWGIDHSGLFAGSGSMAVTSRAAPAICPRASAFTNAGSSSTAPLATLMRNVKSHSSLWVHQTFPQMQEFSWQEGYGAFTVSQSQAETVDQYIQNQVQHHRERSFEEEFIELLKAHGIEYEERYL